VIVSHKYRYLFVEFPYTASTAIHEELCRFYDGTPILWKHAKYHNFLSVASEEEKQYFVFSGIRNPLDAAVSTYLKLKTNHKGKYTDPERRRSRGGFVTGRMLKRYRFVQNSADFAAYFDKFFWIPYDNWSSLAHERFDFVMRFENLQDHFAEVLDWLDIQQARPLPLVNRTSDKGDDFWSYYDTPEIRRHAIRVFGPFMRRWDYSFPSDWGDSSVPLLSELGFRVFGIVRRMYWRHILHNPLYLTLRGWPRRRLSKVR
jgi:hypothetical protein